MIKEGLNAILLGMWYTLEYVKHPHPSPVPIWLCKDGARLPYEWWQRSPVYFWRDPSMNIFWCPMLHRQDNVVWRGVVQLPYITSMRYQHLYEKGFRIIESPFTNELVAQFTFDSRYLRVTGWIEERQRAYGKE